MFYCKKIQKMWANPTYIRLRNKLDSDTSLAKRIKPGDVSIKRFEIPEYIAGKTVKVESVLWKYKRKRFIISYTDPVSWDKSFKTIHPSSIKTSYFYKKEPST